MGNQSSKNKPTAQFHQMYEVLPDSESKILPNTKLVQSKLTNAKVLMKEYKLTELKKEQLEQLNKKVENISNYFLNLIDIFSDQQKFLCQGFDNYIVLFEHIDQTLDQLYYQRKSKNIEFSEFELKKILTDLINIFAQLQKDKVYYGAIRLKNIFVTQNFKVKIADPAILEPISNFSIIKNQESYRNVYLSPEQMEYIGQNHSMGENKYKSDVFILGIILLQCSLLENMDSLYNYSTGTINILILEHAITELKKKKFSFQFYSLIIKMISIQSDRRYDFKDLQQQIQMMKQERVDSMDSSMPLQPDYMDCLNRDYPEFRQSRVNRFDSNTLVMTQSLMKQQQQPDELDSIENMLTIPKIELSQTISPKQQKEQKEVTKSENEIEKISKTKEISQEKLIRIDYDEQIQNEATRKVDDDEDNFDYDNAQAQAQTRNKKGEDDEYCLQQEIDLQATLKSDGTFYSNIQQSLPYRCSDVSDFEIENQETQDYANGAKYIGQKQNGLRHGRGKMLFEDGCIYEGEWENNQMTGQGILFYPSGQVAYQGQWFQDYFNGYGTFYFENPQLLKGPYDYKDLSSIENYVKRYEGEFSYHQKSGQGTLFLSNNEKFEGYFMNNEINGEGKYILKNGKTISGKWENNKMIQ